MTLRDKLNEINKELIKIPRDKIFNDGVNVKLERSQDNYSTIIEKNCKYIMSRNNYKAMMAIDRYNKRKEKKGNEEENKYGFIEII